MQEVRFLVGCRRFERFEQVNGDRLAKKNLTTKEVAQLIGVGEATVKRWAEKQEILSERTLGGHRRFQLEDVARFQHTNSLARKKRDNGVLRIANESGPDSKVLAPELFTVLVTGFSREAALLISAHLSGASVSVVFDDVLCAAMRLVGDRWYAAELSIDQEHLATRTALNALQLLKLVIDLPESTGRLAICCCTEGDFHELPVHLTQMVLEYAGWQVLSLGANTPFFALGEALARHSPDLVCVSSTVLINPDRAAREYLDFRETAARVGTTVLLGGAGFGTEINRRRFPADYYAGNFRELTSFLSQWDSRVNSEIPTF